MTTNYMSGRDFIRMMRPLLGIDTSLPGIRAMEINANIEDVVVVTVDFLAKEGKVVDVIDGDDNGDSKRFEVIVRQVD